MIRIGRYRVYHWEKQSHQGHSGWIVGKDRPEGGLPELISKHKRKADAIAKATKLERDTP